MIALTGATGFLGGRLLKRLIESGERVRVLGRRRPEGPNVEFFQWEASNAAAPGGAFEKCDTVIHLAGSPISQRWNAEVKKEIRSSRVDGTNALVRGLLAAGTRPRTLVCASAIGFYGDRGDETLTEKSPPGSGFLPAVSVEWEDAARRAEASDVRVVLLRFGIVLGNGGALSKMLLPFRSGLGGKLGSGEQWMSWIHIDDAIELIRFAAQHTQLAGPVNAVAPQPVRNAEFTKALADVLDRPAFMRVPKLALSAMYGEMADVMLWSTRVVPEAATSAGFRFRYENVKSALAAAVSEKN
jgi:uncharacterized protein (TIGR01777 family)